MTGRIQLFTLLRQELNNLEKCGVTITTSDITDSNSLIKKTYHFIGFAQTITNKIEDKSPLFQINSFFRGNLLMTFEFGFNNKMFYSSYETFGGRIEGYEDFKRKEIETLEIRFKKSEEEIDWNSKPSFIIIEALENLKQKLADYFKDNSSFNFYRSNNPADSTILITIKNDTDLSRNKLMDFIKQDNINENLLSYNLTQIVIRSENSGKIQYILDL